VLVRCRFRVVVGSVVVGSVVVIGRLAVGAGLARPSFGRGSFGRASFGRASVVRRGGFGGVGRLLARVLLAGRQGACVRPRRRRGGSGAMAAVARRGRHGSLRRSRGPTGWPARGSVADPTPLSDR